MKSLYIAFGGLTAILIAVTVGFNDFIRQELLTALKFVGISGVLGILLYGLVTVSPIIRDNSRKATRGM